MSDLSLDLETLLREKEELIDALTERLELTAEQLDRHQRTNGDRGHWLAGGVPAELVEQQQNLCNDLERVVHQWEEAQPTEALGRIEVQLNELRDLFLRSGSAVAASHRYEEQSPSKRPAPVETPVQEPGSSQSAWEALKAGLLAQEGGGPSDSSGSSDAMPQHQYESVASAPGSNESVPAPVVDNGPDPFATFEPLSPPAEIDVTLADSAALQQAILTRDEFIAELLRRLRTVEGRTRPCDTWRQIESVPEELRSRLESLERRLEETLRMSEVELSLERAKLGREAARVKQLEETAQKAADRAGLGLNARDRDVDVEEPDNRSDGRWARMLGRGKK